MGLQNPPEAVQIDGLRHLIKIKNPKMSMQRNRNSRHSDKYLIREVAFVAAHFSAPSVLLQPPMAVRPARS